MLISFETLWHFHTSDRLPLPVIQLNLPLPVKLIEKSIFILTKFISIWLMSNETYQKLWFYDNRISKMVEKKKTISCLIDIESKISSLLWHISLISPNRNTYNHIISQLNGAIDSTAAIYILDLITWFRDLVNEHGHLHPCNAMPCAILFNIYSNDRFASGDNNLRYALHFMSNQTKKNRKWHTLFWWCTVWRKKKTKFVIRLLHQ